MISSLVFQRLALPQAPSRTDPQAALWPNPEIFFLVIPEVLKCRKGRNEVVDRKLSFTCSVTKCDFLHDILNICK